MTDYNKEDVELEEWVEELDEIIWDDDDQEEFDDAWEQEDDTESNDSDDDQVAQLKDSLMRTRADYQNFKQRTENQKSDMIFFLKQDIFKKILPRLDDLERIIANTPTEDQDNNAFVGIKSAIEKLQKDLSGLGVKAFESVGTEMDPEKHEVMTQVPWEDGIVIDEFEKWYELDWRVLRHAKVTVGNS